MKSLGLTILFKCYIFSSVSALLLLCRTTNGVLYKNKETGSLYQNWISQAMQYYAYILNCCNNALNTANMNSSRILTVYLLILCCNKLMDSQSFIPI